MTGYDVYGVGNALVDIQARVDPPFLEAHGLTKGVMTLVTADRQAELLDRLGDRPTRVSSGGSACNTVVGVAQFGGSAYYAGKVGRDHHGRFFQEDLRALGIRSDLPPADGVTGTCLVLITPDADRTMQTCLASSMELDADDIDEAEVARARFVYVEGYLWDPPGPRRASRRAMELARRHGIPVAYSYSDPGCVRRAREDFRELSRTLVDYVFCNTDEARAVAGCDDPEEACRRIASWGPRVFMTAGPGGAYYAEGARIEHVPAFPARAVDTNGAGDLFAGGTLFGLARGHAAGEAATLGAYAAARVVARMGARLPGPIADSVADILNRSGIRR